MADIPSPSIGIGIGQTTDFILDQNDKLWLRRHTPDGSIIFIPLSDNHCTQARIDFIISCLNQLRIHSS